MDRYLISGTIALLLVQILFLLNLLGLVDLWQFDHSRTNSNREHIGVLLQKRMDVKRKTADSIIWEDSSESDQLYRYDSLLTLENSKAELKLNGDVNLQIYENTLVVLDPLENKDDSLRVRFYRGLLQSRSTRQKFAVGTGEWTIEAKPGTDLSLKSMDQDQLEIEVSRGQIELGNKLTGAKEFIESSKLVLDKKEIKDLRKIVDIIEFDQSLPHRIYTHIQPLAIPLQWHGPATQLQITHPDGHSESISTSGDMELISLHEGTYRLSLIDRDGNTSESKTLEIVPSPKIRYIHPLPRDRFEIDKKEMFSWYPVDQIHKYELRLLDSMNAESVKYPTQTNYKYLAPQKSGAYSWSVFAFDQDGIEIPPYYSLPIYFTEKPLAAPVLNAPNAIENREPANQDTPDQSSILYKILDLLLPQAHAKVNAKVKFTWQAVPGADHYIIEISSDSDFIKPEVIQKITDLEYSWDSYSKDKYYWRVAGGTESGRMGLFSEPAEFNIKDLSYGPNNSGQPYLIKENKKATPEKIIVKKVEPQKTEIKPQPKPTTQVNPKTENIKTTEKRNTRMSVGLNYLIMNQEKDSFGKASYNDFSFPSFFISHELNKRSKVEFKYQHLGWSPKDKDVYPYQPYFSTAIIDVKWSLKQFNILYKSFPMIERRDLEAVEADETSLYGLGYEWDLFNSSATEYKASINLYTDGENHLGVLNLNRLKYYQPKFFYQIQFEGGGLSGADSAKANWLQLEFSYGFEW